MRKSYSKLRHIQELNKSLEQRKLIKEQNGGSDFCENAQYDEKIVASDLRFFEDIKEMVDKLDNFDANCDLEMSMAINMLFGNLVKKWESTMQLSIKNVDVGSKVEELKQKLGM